MVLTKTFVTRGPDEGTLDRTLLAAALSAGAEVPFRSRLDREQADLVATGPQTPDGLARETTFVTDHVERVTGHPARTLEDALLGR